MLTFARRRRWRWMLMMLTTIAVTAGALGWASSTASADNPGECDPPGVWTIVFDENYPQGWGEVCEFPGGGGGGGGDSCDAQEPYDYCSGDLWCFVAGDGHPPWPEPEGPKPHPDSEWVIETCLYDDGPSSHSTWTYPSGSGGQIPSLNVLYAPAFSLHVSPAAMSYVGAKTHFWIETDDLDQIVSPNGSGLVAVGVPKHIEITPGDGTLPFTCPAWPVSDTDECTWRYAKPSVGSSVTGPAGLPSFEATAVLVYDVHWEEIGNPGVHVDVPTTPPEFYTLRSDPQTVTVPVGEIQALVE